MFGKCKPNWINLNNAFMLIFKCEWGGVNVQYCGIVPIWR